ncbi:MAG: hypothetical protein ACRC7N_01755 [Clostridium sp.]
MKKSVIAIAVATVILIGGTTVASAAKNGRDNANDKCKKVACEKKEDCKKELRERKHRGNKDSKGKGECKRNKDCKMDKGLN